MRIWDLDPGFLNNQSLLGEHRELHGIYSILTNNKNGYRNHPETKRWEQRLNAMVIRHGLLVEEMKLRKLNHYSPVQQVGSNFDWPGTYIDPPGTQIAILQRKYRYKLQGRIHLTRNIQELWAKHKYSVMARSYNHYRDLGREVAENRISIQHLADKLVGILRWSADEKSLKNAIDHMWGYVSQHSRANPNQMELSDRLEEIRRLSIGHQVTYLIQSTALGELGYWCRRVAAEKSARIAHTVMIKPFNNKPIMTLNMLKKL